MTDASQLAGIYMPGVWKCAKCNFRLIQSNLNANTGTVTARDEPGDKCPNCASPLWRATWKDEAEENLTIGEQQVARAVAAEAEVARLSAEVAALRAHKTLLRDAVQALLDCPNIADSDFEEEETDAAEKLGRRALAASAGDGVK